MTNLTDLTVAELLAACADAAGNGDFGQLDAVDAELIRREAAPCPASDGGEQCAVRFDAHDPASNHVAGPVWHESQSGRRWEGPWN